MMRVEELIERLKEFDPNAVVLRPNQFSNKPAPIQAVIDTFGGPVIL